MLRGLEQYRGVVVQQCSEAKTTQKRSPRLKSESTLVANLRTAVMLFVVTVVFVITFLPAFLMALKLIPYNIVVFYFYFANNVANPFIYSFMNQVLYAMYAVVHRKSHSIFDCKYVKPNF